MKTAFAVYIAGLIVGLVATDGRLGSRLALAVLWPLGPLAFVVTVTGLVGAAAIAFPPFGIAATVIAGLGVWWLLFR
jgi:hypothetical protein